MDIITPKKNLIFDATVFATFQGCERLCDFKFNRQLVSVEGKSNSLEAGIVAHKVLEYFYKNMINGFSRSDSISNAMSAGEMAIKGCQYCTDFIADETNKVPKCKHQPNEFPPLQNTPPESEGTRIIGWKYILKTMEEYFEYYKNDSWITLAAETVRTKLLYEDDEIRIGWKAKIDRLVDTNNGIYSVDTKTMKQRRDTNSMSHQFMGQCIVTERNTVWIDKVGFQSSLAPKDKFVRVPVNYSNDRLLEWQSEIVPYFAYQYLMCKENDQWPPRFTHCESKYGNCEFYNHDICNNDRSMREETLRMNFIKGDVWDPTNLD